MKHKFVENLESYDIWPDLIDHVGINAGDILVHQLPVACPCVLTPQLTREADRYTRSISEKPWVMAEYGFSNPRLSPFVQQNQATAFLFNFACDDENVHSGLVNDRLEL